MSHLCCVQGTTVLSIVGWRWGASLKWIVIQHHLKSFSNHTAFPKPSPQWTVMCPLCEQQLPFETHCWGWGVGKCRRCTRPHLRAEVCACGMLVGCHQRGDQELLLVGEIFKWFSIIRTILWIIMVKIRFVSSFICRRTSALFQLFCYYKVAMTVHIQVVVWACYHFSDVNAQERSWGLFYGLAYGLSWSVLCVPLRRKYILLLVGVFYRCMSGLVSLYLQLKVSYPSWASV